MAVTAPRAVARRLQTLKQPNQASDLASHEMAAQAAWQVVYRDADGAIRRTQKGFKVPTAGVAGVKLTAEERDAARRSLLVLARQRWNQLDASAAERYKGPLLELPDSA